MIAASPRTLGTMTDDRLFDRAAKRQIERKPRFNLGWSTLTGSLGFTPSAGESFTIIRSTAPIVGTFQGLAEGASVTFGGVPFTIGYAADGGDAVVLTSTATTTLAATITTLASSANPVTSGQPVTFTATVAAPSGAGTPTGSVCFQEGSTVLGTGTLDSSGRATFTTTALALGSDAITAVYTPTGNFRGRSSMALRQVVNAAPLAATATKVTSSDDASTLGQAVTFMAVVTSSAAGTPTGTVTWFSRQRLSRPLTWRNLVLDPPWPKASHDSET